MIRYKAISIASLSLILIISGFVCLIESRYIEKNPNSEEFKLSIIRVIRNNTGIYLYGNNCTYIGPITSNIITLCDLDKYVCGEQCKTSTSEVFLYTIGVYMLIGGFMILCCITISNVSNNIIRLNVTPPPPPPAQILTIATPTLSPENSHTLSINHSPTLSSINSTVGDRTSLPRLILE